MIIQGKWTLSDKGRAYLSLIREIEALKSDIPSQERLYNQLLDEAHPSYTHHYLIKMKNEIDQAKSKLRRLERHLADGDYLSQVG